MNQDDHQQLNQTAISGFLVEFLVFNSAFGSCCKLSCSVRIIIVNNVTSLRVGLPLFLVNRIEHQKLKQTSNDHRAVDVWLSLGFAIRPLKKLITCADLITIVIKVNAERVINFF